MSYSSYVRYGYNDLRRNLDYCNEVLESERQLYSDRRESNQPMNANFIDEICSMHRDLLRVCNLHANTKRLYAVILLDSIHLVTPTSSISEPQKENILRERTWAEQFKLITEESKQIYDEVCRVAKAYEDYGRPHRSRS